MLNFLRKLLRCRNLAAAVLAATLCLLLAGCNGKDTAKANTLTPVKMTADDTSILSNDPSDVFRQHYMVDRKLTQLRLYVEVWQDGKVQNRVFFKSPQSAKSTITLAERESILDLTNKVTNFVPGDPWKQVTFEAAIGSQPLTALSLDLPTNPPVRSVGTSWLGGSSEEADWPIENEKPIIIMYLPFNTEDENQLSVYNCSHLMEYPEALEQYAYALVVKAEFTQAAEDADAANEPPEGPTAYTDLEEAITAAILDRGFSSITIAKDAYVTTAHKTLAVEESADGATAYVAATKLCFSLRGGLTLLSGGYKPAVITFTKNPAGQYTVSDYWQPQDGDSYEDDIHQHFPAALAEKALNMDPYLIPLSQQCYAAALEHSGYNPTSEIKRMIDLIAANPEDSDDLQVHLQLRRYDYNQLLILNEYTIRYVFGEFLREEQTGIRGQLLAKLMSDLLGSERIDEDYTDGQAYFARWKDHVMALRSQNTANFFQNGAPKAYLLLEMTDKTEPTK